MQPWLTAYDGADTVLSALHVLTYLILKPPREVGTIIITLILQMGNCIPKRLIISLLLTSLINDRVKIGSEAIWLPGPYS